MISSDRSFAHLHVRSGFSYGYGVATPEDLAAAASKIEMSSLALTDQDGLYGIPRFLEAAAGSAVSPIVGVEVSVEGGGHLVLLAEGMRGYRSLCRLITAYRCRSADRRRPVCPLPVALEHAEGLVCLTGAVPFGLVPRLLLGGRGKEALGVLGLLREAFGSGLYVQLTDDETAAGRRNAGRVAAFARDAGVPAVAAGEVAYLSPADHRPHEALVAAANLAALPGPDYRPTDRLYLRSGKEMRRLFAHHKEALRNAAAVAERCAGTISLSGKIHMPAAILPPGKTAGRTLLELTVAGVRKRYASRTKDAPTMRGDKGRLSASCPASARWASRLIS